MHPLLFTVLLVWLLGTVLTVEVTGKATLREVYEEHPELFEDWSNLLYWWFAAMCAGVVCALWPYLLWEKYVLGRG